MRSAVTSIVAWVIGLPLFALIGQTAWNAAASDLGTRAVPYSTALSVVVLAWVIARVTRRLS